jgi:hypothetical protein
MPVNLSWSFRPSSRESRFKFLQELLASLPAGAVVFGVPASDFWKWVLKLLECGLKNIALALQGKWVEFASAVLTCVLAN